MFKLKNILHICAGWQKWNGAANIARMIMEEQLREGHKVSFATWAKARDLQSADEVWIHCGWLPCLWWAALWSKNARWMPEACYDPVRLGFSAWKKRLVGPIERWSLRRCERIVATCEAEKGWIQAYLGKKCPRIEIEDIKRFFDFSHKGQKGRKDGRDSLEFRVQSLELGSDLGEGEGTGVESLELGRTLHLLYLGRRHPLKGVEYLEQAVDSLEFRVSSLELDGSGSLGARGQELGVSGDDCGSEKKVNSKLQTQNFELKIVSDAFGEEKERVWDWCDVLVLPTLSDNFGLVVAEALERGKRVITTDGAPAWDVGDKGPEVGVSAGYGGRLLYLKGYRDGTREMRVGLLKKAIEMFLSM